MSGKTTTRVQEEVKKKNGVQQEGGAEESCLVFCRMLGEEVSAWGEETGLASGGRGGEGGVTGQVGGQVGS